MSDSEAKFQILELIILCTFGVVFVLEEALKLDIRKPLLKNLELCFESGSTIVLRLLITSFIVTSELKTLCKNLNLFYNFAKK